MLKIGHGTRRPALLRCLCLVMCMILAGIPAMDTLTLTARAAEPTQYTVTFHANGGLFGTGDSAKETYEKDVNEGSTVTAPTAPKRTGYNTFTAGEWYTEPECINKWTVGSSGNKVTEDITLYAKWTPKTYTVYFKVTSSSTYKTVKQDYDGMLEKPEDPTKAGYTFAGWYMDNNTFTQEWNFDEPFQPAGTSTTVSLYAKWEINTYEVTFDSKGGSAVEPQWKEYNTTISESPVTVKEGYTFGGWFTDETYSSTKEWKFGTSTSAKKVTEDITLYAKWTINKYTVKFEKNGGTGTTSNQTIEHGNKCTKPNDPKKTGYTFKGWYKDAECTDGQEWDFSTDTVTEDITLYAKWVGNEYTVTFDSQGGTEVEPQTVSRDQLVTRPEDPTREGYIFAGWLKSSSIYNFDTKVTSDFTLTAKWTAKEYTITFDSRGGTPVDSKILAYDKTITSVPTTSRTGYKFAGWRFINADGMEAEWKFGSSTTAGVTKVTGDVTIYAKWTAQVTFNLNGGKIGTSSTSKTADVLEGGLIADEQIPQEPQRDGYEFGGWCRDAEGTVPWDFENDAVTQAITLYAGWIGDKYTVTFDTQGGSEIGPQTVSHDQLVTRPEDPTREGYDFDKWVTTKGGSTEFNFESTKIQKDTTIYAKWTVKQYTITFDSKGGSDVASKKVEYDKSTTAPTKPTRTGYTFAGWFTDEAYTDEWVFGTGTSATKVTEDVTLYAKWAPIEYEVTFNGNGGKFGNISTKKIKANYDSIIPAELIPSDADLAQGGYTFTGKWYTDKECTTEWRLESDTVKGNMNLYAGWQINTYTVTFMLDENDVYQEVELPYNSKVTEPEEPTKYGSAFKGWYTTLTGNTKWNFSTGTVKDDTVIYAQWDVAKYTVKFESNGGTEYSSKTGVVHGSKITKPSIVDPKKEGFTFMGWYSDENFAGDSLWDFSTSVVTGDMTLYAKWEVSEYTVSFESSTELAGADMPGPVTVKHGEKVAEPEAPIPTNTSYHFVGWVTMKGGTTLFDFEKPITKTTTVYAKWSNSISGKLYTVSFNANGHGIAPASQQNLAIGDKLTEPEITAEGYTFGGWYKDSACTDAWDFENDTVEKSRILYAKWTANEYTVSFDTQGGGNVSPQKVKYNEKVAVPINPIKDGYNFGGWYTATDYTTEWNFDTDTVKDNMVLHAKWTKDDGPDGDASHKVEVIGGDTPKVTVGGLDSELDKIKEDNQGASNVKITMTVQKKEETELSEEAKQIKGEAPASAVLEYLDIGIKKDIDGAESTVSETSKVIEVKVPFDFNGKSEVTIYREHAGSIMRFTESGSKADGTYTLNRGEGLIHIFTQRFSVYAISYKKKSSSSGGSTGGSTGGTVSYMITASAGEGGSISPSGDIRVVRYMNQTLTITPDDGYQIADVLVDGESVGPVSSYTFTSVLAAHSIRAVFEPVPKPPEDGCSKGKDCPAWPYKDVNVNEWYHDGIHYCLESGLMTGYAAGRFGPNDFLTRAQLTQILYNLAGKPHALGTGGFTDVTENAWYAKAVAWAKGAGVVSGYTDGRFGPNDLITREQLAAMIWRYAGSPAVTETEIPFSDSDKVSRYAESALRWAVSKGIVSGYEDGSLHPRDPATRAQTSSMIMRFCKSE